GGVGELRTAQDHRLQKLPSEYWHSNCYVAASFMHPHDCGRRHLIGAGRIMWGSDYPHLEGTHPFSREAVRRTFSDVEPAEAAALLGRTAAAVYGFDMNALSVIGTRCGPTVDEVAQGLESIPSGARSLAFRERPPLNV
ncbi:MAG TPA: amidohydrolase family protein, partial [Acidimicrobiales bacterium]|nr:amidohydrolase family protein [Acidimicrobiales bacterium]